MVMYILMTCSSGYKDESEVRGLVIRAKCTNLTVMKWTRDGACVLNTECLMCQLNSWLIVPESKALRNGCRMIRYHDVSYNIVSPRQLYERSVEGAAMFTSTDLSMALRIKGVI